MPVIKMSHECHLGGYNNEEIILKPHGFELQLDSINPLNAMAYCILALENTFCP